MEKKDIKLALVMDSYKIEKKDELWAESEGKAAKQIDGFLNMWMVKEEILVDMPGPGLTTIFRYYRKKFK